MIEPDALRKGGTVVSANACLIVSIRIEKLFGMYTYRLPTVGSFSNAAILYGDNGVGKSTILRLAFHLLSAHDDRGHRNALYKAQFERLEVGLSTGITLIADKNVPEHPGYLVLSILEGAVVKAVWHFKPQAPKDSTAESGEAFFEAVELQDGVYKFRRIPDEQALRTAKSSVQSGDKPFLTELQSSAPGVFILHAERQLESDLVSDPSDEVELRRMMHYETPRTLSDLTRRARVIALSQALNSAAQWLQRRAVSSANQGSMNVHGVYFDVLRRLTTFGPHLQLSESRADRADVAFSEAEHLAVRLATIEIQTKNLARYELMTPLDTSHFQQSLKSPRAHAEVVVSVIRPYVDSLEERLKALGAIYQLLDMFVSTLNNFLRDKTVKFRVSHGFSIVNSLGATLHPSQLSSGEQQLLLLFCYVLTARDAPSVFMIDEPEISLNVKWQQQLVKALLDVTSGAQIQFIFASHSMELLAQHLDRVARLENLS
jgi:predicted ATPase